MTLKKVRSMLAVAALALSSVFCGVSPAQQTQKPLANADVLKLLRRGISEQNILATIRNHPATFDVSNQARASFDKECAAIKPANVSTGAWATEIGDVWNAMKNVVICQETNGRGGEGTCDLSPLQSSPKKTSAEPKHGPSKGYEPITLERVVTQDTRFANWANSGQAPSNGSPSTSKAKSAINVDGTGGTSAGMNTGNKNASELNVQPSAPETVGQRTRRLATTVQIAPNVTPLPSQRPNQPQRPAGYGVLAGYVFWDTNAVKHIPANSCSGVNVAVARGGMIVGTASGNMVYMGTVGTYAVCKYAVKSLPQELDLQVGVDVASGAFSSAVLPEGSKTVKIMGGEGGVCFGPVVPSQTELLGSSRTCPGYAEDVNLGLIPASRVSITGRVAGPVRIVPGTPVQGPSNGSRPLMTSGGQQTMLGAQARPLLADGSVRTGIVPTGTPKVGASQTMSATGKAGNSRMLAPPQTVAPTGSPSTNSGVLLLGGGANQGGSKTNVIGGNLVTGGGTNQGGSKTNVLGGNLVTGGGTNQGGSKTNVLGGNLVTGVGTNQGGSKTNVLGGNLVTGVGTNQGGSKTNVLGGNLVTGGGTNQGGSKTNVLGGNLVTGGGTNQGGSRTVAPPQTIALAGAPEMRPAPASQVDHPATPQSPIGANVTSTLSTVRMAAGSVGGYVFWDTSTVHYQLSAPCQGLKVTISTTSSGGLQTVAGTTNFTTPFGPQPVWNFSGQGSQGPWMVCSYDFHQVPEGAPLQVDAVVTQPSAFTSPVTLAPASPQGNHFEIPGGNCNSVPDSTLAVVLNSGSILCGDSAFNVNFAGLNTRLNAAPAIMQKISPGRIGASQTMSAQGNAGLPVGEHAGTTPLASRAGSLAATRTPIAIQENPNVFVAQECAKDPTFRVLGVSGGTSDGSGGVTLTVEQQYTILGCSFGDAPLVKKTTTPVSSSQSIAAQPNHYHVSIWMTPPNMPLLTVDASIQSWSDNAIVVIFHHSAIFDGGSISLPGKVFPAQLPVARADDQTFIYGHEGGLSFKLPN